jgi:hypothetical protein
MRQNLHSSLTDALQETSSEQLELSSSNLYINVESRNIDEEQRETSNQTFDLDVAEITPCTLDKNPCTNATLDTQSEKRVNDKQISPNQEVLQWPNTPKKKV